MKKRDIIHGLIDGLVVLVFTLTFFAHVPFWEYVVGVVLVLVVTEFITSKVWPEKVT
jgi:hypothetical protein